MYAEIYIKLNTCDLKKEVINYLKDAGFSNHMFNVKDFKDRDYLHVFMSSKAIDFILKDIKKSKWNYTLEIKKYNSKNPSAVFTFK